MKYIISRFCFDGVKLLLFVMMIFEAIEVIVKLRLKGIVDFIKKFDIRRDFIEFV